LSNEVGVFGADLFFLALEAHRTGDRHEPERFERIGFEKVAKDRRLIEMGFDQMGYFFVSGRELAPMNAGLIMVGGMIAVVEHHKIGKAAGKIAGVIIVRFFIGVYVLDIIKDHNNKKGYLLGDDDKEQGFSPVDQQGDDNKETQEDVLNDGQHEFLSFIPVEGF